MQRDNGGNRKIKTSKNRLCTSETEKEIALIKQNHLGKIIRWKETVKHNNKTIKHLKYI